MKALLSEYTDTNFTKALHMLLKYRKGDLIFDDNIISIKYIIQKNGRLLVPSMVAMLRAENTILVIPEDSSETENLQLQISLTKADSKQTVQESEKWNIYHGNSPDIHWATVDIDGAKIGRHWVDGEALMLENPLDKVNSNICSLINSKHSENIKNTLKAINITSPNPKIVGVDPWGIDIRGELCTFRIDADKKIKNLADVLNLLN